VGLCARGRRQHDGCVLALTHDGSRVRAVIFRTESLLGDATREGATPRTRQHDVAAINRR
jgi:hypothetical protein